MRKRTYVWGAVCMALFAGCAVSSSSDRDAGSEFTAPAPIVLGTEVIPLGDLGEAFETTAELVETAPSVAVLRYVKGAPVSRVSLVDPADLKDLDASVVEMLPSAYHVEMTVVDVVAGDLKIGQKMTVVSPFELPGETGTPLLTAGSDFLLFLGRRTFVDGDHREEYGVLGWLEGYFQRTGRDEFSRLDPRESSIPERLSLDTVRAEVARATRSGARPAEAPTD